MADREKLISLVRRAITDWEHGDVSERIADHLIAHGVTVRERGRWEDRYGGKYANPCYDCPKCRKPARYKCEADELGNAKWVQDLTDFCPNCGADMRGEEDG